jgi:hypothetical protein
LQERTEENHVCGENKCRQNRAKEIISRKPSLGRSRIQWKNYFKMYVSEIARENGRWMKLA